MCWTEFCVLCSNNGSTEKTARLHRCQSRFNNSNSSSRRNNNTNTTFAQTHSDKCQRDNQIILPKNQNEKEIESEQLCMCVHKFRFFDEHWMQNEANSFCKLTSLHPSDRYCCYHCHIRFAVEVNCVHTLSFRISKVYGICVKATKIHTVRIIVFYSRYISLAICEPLKLSPRILWMNGTQRLNTFPHTVINVQGNRIISHNRIKNQCC